MKNITKMYLKYIYFAKYTNPLTYLLTYRLRLTDINIIIKLYLEYFFSAQCAFLNIKPKKCFSIRMISV